MPRVRRSPAPLAVLLALGLVALVALVGCGDDDTDGDAPEPPPGTTAAPPDDPADDPAEDPPDPNGTDDTVAAVVYFLRDEQVAVARRTVEGPEVARSALEALFAGPTGDDADAGFATAIPDGTRLLDVAVDDRVATVDLSGEFESGGGTASALARVAQVVFTVTQFDTVDAVAFRIDGDDVETLGPEGLVVSPPVSRVDFPDQTPVVLVEEPAPGDQVSSPLTVRGQGAAFEGTIQLRLTDGAGDVLVETFTTGEGANGIWGPFEAVLEFAVDEAGPATLVAFEIDARDGDEIHRYPVAVTVSPSP